MTDIYCYQCEELKKHYNDIDYDFDNDLQKRIFMCCDCNSCNRVILSDDEEFNEYR